MNEKPFEDGTVLVLGAGASQPFNFPLGNGLKQLLHATPSTLVKHAIADAGISDDLYKRFLRACSIGGHATIDAILDEQPEYRELGSYLVAATISGLEIDANLFRARCWYDDLYERLRLGADVDEIPDVSIITFNYERSLECYLDSMVESRCRQSLRSIAHDRFDRLKIFHPHGSLGDYRNVPYGGASADVPTIHSAARSIRIISDRLENSDDFKAARLALSCAQHVIFLGWGYHDQTLRATVRDEDLQRAAFYGTALNLHPDVHARLSAFFGSRIKMGGGNQDIVAFLRDTVLHDPQ